MIDAEVGLLELDIEEVLSSGEMEGAGLRGEAGALFEQIGDVIRGKGLVDQGVRHGPGYSLRAIDVTQGDDLAHMMVRGEASLFELAVIGLGLGGEGEKAPEELLIAGLFALLKQGLGVIRVFEIAVAVVASDRAGDELLALLDAESVGRGFQRQDLAREMGRDGVAVGVEGEAKLPRRSDRRHGGDIKGMPRQWAQRGLFRLPQLGGFLAGFAVHADIGHA